MTVIKELEPIKSKALRITELLFLLIAAVSIAELVLATTTLGISVPPLISLISHNLLIVVVLIRAACQIRDKLMWIGIAVAFLYLFVWDTSYFHTLALLTLGCIGISYRKVLAAYLASAGSIVISAMALASSESISNLVYLNKGHLRSSMGIIFPTDYATIVLFLGLALWVLWKKLPDPATLIIPTATFAVAYYLARSRTSMICGVLFALAILYLVIEKSVIDKHERYRRLKQAVDILIQLAFPICMMAMFVMTFAFSRGLPFAGKLNKLMSGRLQLTVNAFNEQHLSFFGYWFPQVGFGGSIYGKQNYNFIDSTYPRVLLLYGVVTLIVVGALWVFLTRRSVKAGDRRLAFALAIIAFHSISEHHFIEFNYNIFLILPLAVIDAAVPEESRSCEPSGEKSISRALAAQVACYVIGAAVCWMALPGCISCLSLWYMKLGDTNAGKWFLVLIISAACALSVTAIVSIGYIVRDLIERKKPDKYKALLMVPGALMLAAVCIANAYIINKALPEHSAELESDRDAFQVLTESKTGKLYVSKLGELYAHEYSGVDRSVLGGEDLARSDDATVVIERGRESQAFTGKGFLYCDISDAHAVYTNDDGVVKGLSDAGYHVMGYCPASGSAQLEQKLEDTVFVPAEDGVVKLGGDDHVRMYNSHMDIFSENDTDLMSGRYVADFSLKIDPAEFDTDYSVCRLTVSAYSGEMVIRTTDVYRSWFDENGELDEKVVFTTGNYPDITFSVIMTGDEEMELRGIEWQKSPLYDVHSEYASNGLKTRDVYYNNEGHPTTNNDGYASCTYEYNNDRSITAIHYYDLDSRPVNNKYGYSDLIRTYDSSNRLIREEYFDKDGKRALDQLGCAIVERDYDEAGNAAVIRYLGPDNEPVTIIDGYSEVHRTFDDDKLMTEELYLDTKGKPAELPGGYSGIQYLYDSKGRITVLRYTDEQGNAVENTKGYSVVRRELNESGQIIEEDYRSADSKRAESIYGYQKKENLYDGSGRNWLSRYYDTNGDPADPAQIRCEYNDYDWMTKVICQDADGKPSVTKEGFVYIEFEYDGVGNCVSRKMYDADGKEVEVTDEAIDEVLDRIL